MKKTGYELTPFMKWYNENTEIDYEAGYDPKALDEHYKDKEQMLYDKGLTAMPNEIDFTFNIESGGVNFTKEAIDLIKDNFEKF